MTKGLIILLQYDGDLKWEKAGGFGKHKDHVGVKYVTRLEVLLRMRDSTRDLRWGSADGKEHPGVLPVIRELSVVRLRHSGLLITAVDALRRQLELPPPGLRPNFALAMVLADAIMEVV